MSVLEPAILALADGSVFRGHGIGASGIGLGEVVFNTSMSGYQEILTDPSYCRQIVALTYPHIGNVGVNPEDEESDRIHAAGLIIRDLPVRASNFRMTEGLSDYLARHGVVGITGVDTRRLTRLLRDKGAQPGCIMVGRVDEAEAIAQARSCPGMAGLDLAREVSRAEITTWREGEWRLGQGFAQAGEQPYKVVAYDFGVKRNILRMLTQRGCQVTVVPAQTPASQVLALKPDGVFLSNGPGDPEPCTYAVAAIQEILSAKIPIYGICLGHQLLALASGARTMKMKYGHHGANHPVQELATGQVMITSQNHGFAVDDQGLPANLRVTHRSLFDNSIQGIECVDVPAFSFQGHPEASAGPHDVNHLFDRFIGLMRENKHA